MSRDNGLLPTIHVQGQHHLSGNVVDVQPGVNEEAICNRICIKEALADPRLTTNHITILNLIFDGFSREEVCRRLQMSMRWVKRQLADVQEIFKEHGVEYE